MFCIACGTEVPNDADYCYGCGRPVNPEDKAKSAPRPSKDGEIQGPRDAAPRASPNPGCGCSPSAAFWILTIISGIGIFTFFYDYSGENFTEVKVLGTETVRVDCDGDKQIGGGGCRPRVRLRLRRRGWRARQNMKPWALGVGLLAGGGAFAARKAMHSDPET